MNESLLELAGTARRRIALATAVGLSITACHALQGVFLSLALAALFTGSPVRDAIAWIVAFANVLAVRGALCPRAATARSRT